MPDRVKHYNDDTSADNITAAAATLGIGGAAAASFFNSGHGQELNDFLIRKKFEVQEVKKYLAGHDYDLATMSRVGLSDAMSEAHRRFESVRNGSAAYSYTNDSTLRQFVKWKTATSDRSYEDIFRQLYRSQMNNEFLGQIDTSVVDSRYKRILKDEINTITADNNDVNRVVSKLRKRLTHEEVANPDFLGFIEELVENVNQYKADNSIESFKANALVRNQVQAMADAMFDVTELQINQARQKISILSRIADRIMGDSNVSIGQVREWHRNNTAEWNQVMNLFQRDLAPKLMDGLNNMSRQNVIVSLMDQLAEWESSDTVKADALKKLELNNIKIGRNGRIYTNADTVRFAKEAMLSGLTKFPFSSFHLQDMLYGADTPGYYVYNAGDVVPEIAKIVSADHGNILDRTIVFKNGRFYEPSETGLKLVQGLEEFDGLMSIKTGLGKERFNSGYGFGPQNDVAKLGDIERFANRYGIDFNKIVRTKEFGNNAGLFGTFSNENAALLEDAYSAMTSASDSKVFADAHTVMNGAGRYTKFLKKNTTGLNGDMASRLIGQGLDDELLSRIARLENAEEFEQVIRELAGFNGNIASQFNNNRISRMVRSYLDDPAAALGSSVTSKDLLRTSEKGQYGILSFRQQLQRELSEEILLRAQNSPDFSYSRLFGILETRLAESDAENIKNLTAATDYFSRLERYTSYTDYLDDIENAVTGIRQLTTDIASGNADANELARRLSLLNTRYSGSELAEDITGKISTYNVPVYQPKKSVKVLDPRAILADLNAGQYEKAGRRTISFVDQFFNDPATAASLPFDHLMRRVNNLLNGKLSVGDIPEELPLSNFEKITGHHLGFGLKSQDALTGGMILKNFMLKRVLPLWVGYQALDFLDDSSKAVTGQGLKESGLSGLANLELAVKKVTGFLGLDSNLKYVTKDNAIARYYAGILGGDIDPEWKTYEEAADWYENGYNAIRKSRYWTFGSTNEFRGGKIQYFEPNSQRLAASDYYNESMYNGSFFTKWNPLRILDPYYLEDLHYNDRPYPISGGYWDDNTPWGVLLNATIGDNIIKPRRLMHSERLYGGVDVKAIIAHVNDQIRAKDRANNNILVLRNGRFEAMDFVSYNQPTSEEEIASFDGYGNRTDYSSYGQYGGELNPLAEDSVVSAVLSDIDKLNIAAAKGNRLAGALTSISRSNIAGINQSIRAKASRRKNDLDASQGMLIDSGFSNHYDAIDRFIDDSETVQDLLNDSHADYVQQMATTTRLISGLYGYMGNQFFGLGDYNGKHIANSGDMTSTSRWFWDMNIGGLGGEPAEAMRRFIPEFRRSNIVNPLMNEMPEWMPEKYRFGDPYTALPGAEARMPGRGYEAIHGLHPDVFGDYGAFDRYKILADVAPGSNEYKIWKKIAGRTVTDPKLKREMKRIEERVDMQRRQRDFSEYQYVGRSTTERRAYITEVMNGGKFKVTGSEQVYKLAGINVSPNDNEDAKSVLSRYIAPGTSVTLVTDDNEYYSRNNDKETSINAGLMIGGESLSSMMLEAGDATKRASDLSAAAVRAGHRSEGNVINYMSELLAHANIPVFHDRFLRVNNALEDYKDQYLYGSSFQDWARPIDTFVMPALRTYASSGTWMGIGIASDILYNNMETQMNGDRYIRDFIVKAMEDAGIESAKHKVDMFNARHVNLAKWANFLDRGSLLGNISAEILHYGGSDAKTAMRKYGRRIGNATALGFAAVSAPENLAVQALSWSRLGFLFSDLFHNRHNPKTAFASAVTGAAIGIARWAGSVKLLASDETANTYIPDEARRRWNFEEYWDRLTYLKYMGLYNRAADKAEAEEGVNIRQILESQTENMREIANSRRELTEAISALNNRNDNEAKKLRQNLQERLDSLKEVENSVPVEGREYTKSAVMYYNAAQATMYALNENSSTQDVFRALPKTEREYYLEFMKEKDPAKQKEILKTVSPSLRKALKISWYGDYGERPESMESYFSSMTLPGPQWAGWNPNIDLDDVKAKVIANEGSMNPSDFGIYASQYRDPNVINAPNIEYHDGGDGIIISSLKVQSILKGYGLYGVEVNVSPKKDSTIDVIANVATIATYKIDTGLFS